MFHLAGMAEIEILIYLFKGGLPSNILLCLHVLLLKCVFVADYFVSKSIVSCAEVWWEQISILKVPFHLK